MTNLLALCLVLSTLFAAEVWSPSQTTTTHPTASESDVMVKDGHSVVVVKYDRDGKTNTRVSISPPSADERDEEEKGPSSLSRNAKEKAKETVVTEEVRDHHTAAGEVICDAFGKCRQKIASVVGRAKYRTTDTVDDAGETISDAGNTMAGKVHDVKETVARGAHVVEEIVADKAQYAKEKVAEETHDVKETVAHKAHYAKEKVTEKAYDMKETVAHKAHESKERAKNSMREKARELKEKAAQESQNAWEGVKSAARVFWSATSAALSPKKVASVVGLTAMAMAFGTCVWVTFVSSYVLASVLGRQQLGVVQSKLYHVYFKVISLGILVGLLCHMVSRRLKVLSDATEMWQGAMFERMKAEKEEGRGEKTREEEVRRKLEKLSERLSKLNTYSSLLNIMTFMSITWHFVYLGERLGAAC